MKCNSVNLNSSIRKIGFASISGFEEKENDLSYMIDGDDIYKN